MSQSPHSRIAAVLLSAGLLLALPLHAADEVKKVLSTTEIDLGTHSVVFQRVEPPKEVVAPVAAPVSAVASALSGLSREEIVAKWIRLRSVLLSLSCTVYESGVTEVRWREESGEEVRIVSSIDFNFLRGVGEFTTEERRYSVFMAVGNAMSSETATRLRASGTAVPVSVVARAAPVAAEVLAELKKEGGSRYVIVSAPEGAGAEVFRAMDDLHRHYDAHKDELAAAWRQSEVDRTAREQWEKEHPPVPQDTVIQFWPKKGSRYLGTTTSDAAAATSGEEAK